MSTPSSNSQLDQAKLEAVKLAVFLANQLDAAGYYLEKAIGIRQSSEYLERSRPVVRDFMAYFQGALNSYARCFNKSKLGVLKALDVFTEREHLKLHGPMIELRNTFVAHRDHSEFEEFHCEVTIRDGKFRVRTSEMIHFRVERLNHLDLLIRVATAHVDRARVAVLDQLGADLGLALGIQSRPRLGTVRRV